MSNGDVSTTFSSDLSTGKIFTTSSGDFAVSMFILDTAQATKYISTTGETLKDSSEIISTHEREKHQVFSRTASAEVVERDDNGKVKEVHNWEMSDVTPSNLSSSVVYQNVFSGTDLRYNLVGYQIKEEIIINTAQNNYRYDFMMYLDGLFAVLNSDGSVSLVDEEKREIYQIPAPYMIDAAGELSESVTYTLNQVEDGVILTVHADENWLNDANRQFPVRIDPTLNLKVYTSNNGQGQSMYLTFVEENDPTQTGNGTDQIYIGYGQAMRELQGYIHVNTLPTLPLGTIVTQTVLNMYMTSYSSVGCNEMPIGLYEVDSTVSTGGQSYFNWIRNMSWSNRPGFIDSNMLDYVVLSEQTLYWNYGYQPVTWDLTELAKKWYREGTENRTIALALTSDDYSSSKCAVLTLAAYKPQDYTTNVNPSLIVSYRNNTGIEPYYSYTTLGAGSAGTAYIADATGQLKAGKQLVQYASNVNPVSVNLIYNSDYFASDNTTGYQPMAALGLNMTVGAGWRIDCVQKIEAETISGTQYLKYYDGDGTIHYFLKDSRKSSTYYYDEDGLGLKIKSTGTNAYEMSDDFGNKWIFSNKFLAEISDETGNKVFIKYSNSKLTSIVQQNKGYGQITVATFSYDGNAVKSVTDAAGNVYLLGYSGGNLTSITKQNTNSEHIVAQYAYSGYRLNQLKDSESGYTIAFTYSDGSISRFQEKVNTTTGATVEVTYPNYTQTTYTNYGADRYLGIKNGKCDDISTHYLFDHAGRTVNAYTTDSNGTVLGASNAVYTGSGSTDKQNNRTLQTSSIGTAGQQLLRNTGFELTTAWTLNNMSIVQSGQRTGLKALKGTLQTSGTVSAARATESLIAGKIYTFSAYVNTDGVTSFGSNGIFLQVNQGSNIWTSPKLNYKSSSELNDGWVRISLTFEAKSSAAHTVSVRFNGCSGASGTFYVDDLQLEAGEAPSNVNLLENGSMAMSSHYNWVLSDAASIVGNNYLQINGSPTDRAANASQTVKINLPSSETYVLSGWVKANAVPDNENTASDPAQDTLKQCGLRAVIKYADVNTLEYHYFPFSADLSEWQFVSGTIVPKRVKENPEDSDIYISEITVYCAYEGNANVAQFDNISLVREVAQTMAYDEDGNIKSVTSTGLQADQSTYENGNLIETVTGGYGTYKYSYDTTYAHRLTEVKLVDEDEHTILTQTLGYDAIGNVTSTKLTGSNGSYLQTSATYGGNNNRLVSVTDASGKTVSYGYGNAHQQMMGQPTSEKMPNNSTYAYGYDNVYYRLHTLTLETKDNLGYIVNEGRLAYEYEDGYLKSLVRDDLRNNSSQTYSFENDAFGNAVKIQVGSRTLATYTYASGNGLLQSMAYENGGTVEYTYDALDRVKTIKFPDGRELTYTYSGDGHVYSTTETGGDQAVQWLYTYDSLDRLIMGQKLIGTETTEGMNWVPDTQVFYGYNDKNQLVSQSWQVGSNVYTTTFAYDETDGNLSSFGTGIGTESLTMGYDSLRRLSSVTGGAYSKTYTYRGIEGSNQTTTQVSQLAYNLPTNRTFAYEYDNMGNISKYTDSNIEVTYTYDIQGQLLTASNGYSYTYDTVGNILTGNGHTYTYGDTSGWVDLLTEVDDQNITYDAIGNPTSYYNGTRWNFGWANGRQLVSAIGGGNTLSYTYDADGIRTSKTVNGTEHVYYYAGGKLLRETYGSNTLDFFYDANGTPYALKYGNTVYYYITNLQGDVMYMVNGSGQEVAAYTYDPYGNVLTASGSMAEVNPLRYRGYYYDSETGFYYLQSRYYDPELGRFINADSFASTGQGLLGNNMFAYCGNNPIIRFDPTGHRWWGDFWKGAKEFFEEQKEKASENGSGTGTIGITGSAAFGVGGSVSLGITFDEKGNVGLAYTTNVGGGFPSAGIGGFITITDAPNIYKQNGLGTVVGASGGPGVMAVGGEYSLMIDTVTGETYNGATFSATAGLYPTVVEIHGEVGNTFVGGFNVFDIFIGITDIMLWIGQGGKS